MGALLRVLLLAAVVGLASAGSASNKKHGKPEPPVWADQYKIKFDFKIPYVREYQKQPLINHFEIFQDVKHGHQRAIKDELETVLSLADIETRYTIYPAKDDYECMKAKLGGGPLGPTRRLLSVSRAPVTLRAEGEAEEATAATVAEATETESESESESALGDKAKVAEILGFVMPDLTEKRWVYQGAIAPRAEEDEVSEELDLAAREGGAEALAAAFELGRDLTAKHGDVHLYEYDLTQDGMQQTYRMFVSHGGEPLRLWQLGTNLYTGGHKDVYISDFHDYQPVKSFPDDTFTVPSWGNCKGANGADIALAPLADALNVNEHAVNALRRMTPSSHYGDAAYDAFAHRHGRRHAHAEEYAARAAEFHANVAKIAAHNARANGADAHVLSLNRWADWTAEEYEAVTRPRESKREIAADNPAVGRHVRAMANSLVPSELNWQGTPADSPVKDQGACGSCWTFSTVGAIESAFYRQKGFQTLFSEQNLVDCNWIKTNKGCYGGQQIDAFNWVFGENKGLATTEDYPYRAVNDFCRHDAPKQNFTGRMVLVEGGEEALKEALASKGPMTVSVDAGDDSFRFYSGGIYRRASCSTKATDLDHAVILSGYGTTADGVDYWLIKNMWSPYWGEDGYMRVARGPNDCGIATEPLYVELEFL